MFLSWKKALGHRCTYSHDSNISLSSFYLLISLLCLCLLLLLLIYCCTCILQSKLGYTHIRKKFCITLFISFLGLLCGSCPTPDACDALNMGYNHPIASGGRPDLLELDKHEPDYFSSTRLQPRGGRAQLRRVLGTGRLFQKHILFIRVLQCWGLYGFCVTQEVYWRKKIGAVTWRRGKTFLYKPL